MRQRLDDWEKAVEVARKYATGPMGGSDDKAAIAVVAEDGRRLWSTDDLLAQVAAMRAIVDEYEQLDRESDRSDGLADLAARVAAAAAARDAVRHLASAWSSHSDYDPAWAPTAA